METQVRTTVTELNQDLKSLFQTITSVSIDKKYVMKADAHTAWDKDFDTKMIEAFEEAGDDAAFITHALGVVAKAKGPAERAKASLRRWKCN